MKALVVQNNLSIKIQEVARPELQKGHVIVKLKASALNRRDQWIREGKYPNIKPSVILGSDGAGIVVEASKELGNSWLDKPVIINPNIDWGDNPEVQSKKYQVLGMPTNGTHAEYISVPVHRLQPKSEALSFEEAAALPLGGLAAYRACFHHGQVKEGNKVLISGFGVGVAQFAFQFVMVVNAKTYVTSGHKNNIKKALEMGAIQGYDYTMPNWITQCSFDTKGGFDIIIDSAGGHQFNELIKLLKPGGRLVFYGATNGLPETINLYHLFWRQCTLQGSTMGNDQEFIDMLKFVDQHNIKPIIGSSKPFSEIIKAFNSMKEGELFGKSVITF